jgi:tripartite-type tricarboxylate transporter receptor subunit TctC
MLAYGPQTEHVRANRTDIAEHGRIGMRAVRLGAAIAALIVMGSGSAGAQSGPIRILAGFPPGGNVDILARVFADQLGKTTGRTAIVVNKAGAAGQIAAEALIASPPDGDTLMVAPDATVVERPLVMSKPPYDAVKDFAAVAQTGAQDYAIALTVKILPATLKDFAAWAKAHPEGANFASLGEGGVTHFLGLMVGEAIGVPLRHVPYNGAGPANNAVMAGEVSSTVQPIGTLVHQAEAGTLRVVAVTGRARSQAFPSAPTMVELGYPSVVATSWFGVFAPAKTPAATVARLNAFFIEAMRTPQVAAQMKNLLLDVHELTPAQFADLIKADSAHWRPIIKASGFTIDVH